MPKTVLLADDSLTIQRVVTLTFANEDVTITSVSDGDQAVESISRKRPDLVLADIAMPGRSGYQVAEFVRSRPELSELPVLLLAGAFDHIDEAHVRTVGADGVLTKPFEPKALIGHVKQLLATGRPEPVAQTEPASRPVAAIEAGSQSSAVADVPTPISIDRAFSALAAPVAPVHDATHTPVAETVTAAASEAPAVPDVAVDTAVPSLAAAADEATDAAEVAADTVTASLEQPTVPTDLAAAVAALTDSVVAKPVVAEPVSAEPAPIHVLAPVPISIEAAAAALEAVDITEAPPVAVPSMPMVDAPVVAEPEVVAPQVVAPPIPRTPSPDTYFEQIDQAFAALAKAPRPSLNLVPKPPAPAPVAEQSRDEVIAAVVEPKLASFTAALRAAEAPARTIPLSDAFNALLDAERAGVIDTTVRLSGVPAFSPVDVDALATQVMNRVLEQMTDRVVRETVTEIVSNTAERLIREEIEQVKRNIT